MSIANELSSDIAAAMLAPEEDKRSVKSSDLMDAILNVHTTLRHLSMEARRRDHRLLRDSSDPSSSRSRAANGNH